MCESQIRPRTFPATLPNTMMATRDRYWGLFATVTNTNAKTSASVESQLCRLLWIKTLVAAVAGTASNCRFSPSAE